jgi:hypothetical protein
MEASDRDQLGVRSPFCDSPSVENHNQVGGHHRGQTVAITNDVRSWNSRVSAFLGDAVEVRGRLVEDEDRRVLLDDAGGGEALLLSASSALPVGRRR